MISQDTIVALATAHGVGAIAVIRLSGNDAISIADKVLFTKKGLLLNLLQKADRKAYFAIVKDADIVLDEVIAIAFRAPHSFTGENVVEISCHGSVFIQQQILLLLTKSGARLATPGEFTMRAFLNGKMDLSQAEAVADLIASNSATSHQVAMQQMRGGFSSKIKTLRENLVNFASLLELELDFSEEDVEFANRADLRTLIVAIQKIVQRLMDSFEFGNVIKNGIPVAIVGKPNAGKSRLLNALLEEERAIVSEIPGTTRDTIEDNIIIDGILFRFIDTAGIRHTTDVIEQIGVAKTFEAIKQSAIIIYLFDIQELTSRELKSVVAEIEEHLNKYNSQLIIVGNKIDKADLAYTEREFQEFKNTLFISAKYGNNINALKAKLVELFDSRAVNVTETVVTNARHAEALRNANKSLIKILDGLNTNQTTELIASDVRNALHQLGLITGEISTDNLLENIFSKFCIGK
ncbi:MAG: tRNA uridine-5-carboxymethylaminomethyl(34) synthesis GTPase MnmE [Bacteroidetes bacterium]|nr:tRNA uridine-5-carboxymethylaminomethyl(34) synthesis GTPase MnmE [Bacteroidota bacterium]